MPALKAKLAHKTREVDRIELDSYVGITDAHHSAGSGAHLDMIFSCRFSFIAPKSASREERMVSLRILFDSMTERVDEAYRKEGLL
jgi:hypothetical protein